MEEDNAASVSRKPMDEATFVNGFTSRATRSYTVRIGHRFAKDSEIVLNVAAINAKHQDLIRAQVIA